MTSFMQRVLTKVRPSESLRQVMALNTSDKRLFLRYLHDVNTRVDAGDEGEGLFPAKRGWFGSRNFFQLPCCPSTRQRRALWMKERGWSDKAVLLLGDDDLLSVELIKQGFTNVTVADCDEGVLREIEQRCRSLGRTPWLMQADFSSPSFRPPQAMEVVLFDPPQNMQGVRVFFESALRAAEGANIPVLVMMLNPYLVGPGFHDLLSALAKRGIVLRNRQPFFNAYPVRGWESVVLRTVLFLFHGFRAGKKRGVFFGSDLFEFTHQSQEG